MLPETPQDYRDRADECERWAADKYDERDRQVLLDAASCWRAIADADEGKVAMGETARQKEFRSRLKSP